MQLMVRIYEWSNTWSHKKNTLYKNFLKFWPFCIYFLINYFLIKKSVYFYLGFPKSRSTPRILLGDLLGGLAWISLRTCLRIQKLYLIGMANLGFFSIGDLLGTIWVGSSAKVKIISFLKVFWPSICAYSSADW